LGVGLPGGGGGGLHISKHVDVAAL
jgi:hypothetical protein